MNNQIVSFHYVAWIHTAPGNVTSENVNNYLMLTLKSYAQEPPLLLPLLYSPAPASFSPEDLFAAMHSTLEFAPQCPSLQKPMKYSLIP